MMKDFLNTTKKFLKVLLIAALSLIVIGSIIGGYTYYKDKIEQTIDQEIGLLCDSPENEGYIE